MVSLLVSTRPFSLWAMNEARRRFQWGIVKSASGAGVRRLHSPIEKTAGYSERTGSPRGDAQPSIVPRRQIQQALLYEWIGIFSKAAAAICLLFQKGTFHFDSNTTNDLTWHGLLGFF